MARLASVARRELAAALRGHRDHRRLLSIAVAHHPWRRRDGGRPRQRCPLRRRRATGVGRRVPLATRLRPPLRCPARRHRHRGRRRRGGTRAAGRRGALRRRSEREARRRDPGAPLAPHRARRRPAFLRLDPRGRIDRVAGVRAVRPRRPRVRAAGARRTEVRSPRRRARVAARQGAPAFTATPTCSGSSSARLSRR